MAILFLKKGEYFFMLKKVSTILSALILTISLFFMTNTPIFNSNANTCEVYLDSCSNSNKIISVVSKDYPFILGKKGESTQIEKQTFNLHTFLLEMRAHLIFSEEIEGKTSYYAYSTKIKYMQKVKGHNINLHIVVCSDTVKVGSPIIYGSF